MKIGLIQRMIKMTNTYINDSGHKGFIRERWVEYIQETITDKSDGEECSIITLPSDGIQDLEIFANSGIISWELTETGAYNVIKGKVTCFEKKQKIWKKIRQKLVNVELINLDIGKYLQQNYTKLLNGNANIFPADIINLDFDGNLSKNDPDIKETIDLIFKFQEKHNKTNFALFLTFPQTETEDGEDFKEQLKEILVQNIKDQNNSEYISKFETKYISIDDLGYDEFVIIGITKLIISAASNHKYKLLNQAFYIYGEESRRKMLSILLKFENQGGSHSTPSLYYENVVRVLEDINNLNT